MASLWGCRERRKRGLGADMGGQNLSDQEGEDGRLDPPADSHWLVFLPRQTPSPFPGRPGELCIRDTASLWDWISRCDVENRACPAELAKGLRDGHCHSETLSLLRTRMARALMAAAEILFHFFCFLWSYCITSVMQYGSELPPQRIYPEA